MNSTTLAQSGHRERLAHLIDPLPRVTGRRIGAVARVIYESEDSPISCARCVCGQIIMVGSWE